MRDRPPAKAKETGAKRPALHPKSTGSDVPSYPYRLSEPAFPRGSEAATRFPKKPVHPIRLSDSLEVLD